MSPALSLKSEFSGNLRALHLHLVREAHTQPWICHSQHSSCWRLGGASYYLLSNMAWIERNFGNLYWYSKYGAWIKHCFSVLMWEMWERELSILWAADLVEHVPGFSASQHLVTFPSIFICTCWILCPQTWSLRDPAGIENLMAPNITSKKNVWNWSERVYKMMAIWRIHAERPTTVITMWAGCVLGIHIFLLSWNPIIWGVIRLWHHPHPWPSLHLTSAMNSPYQIPAPICSHIQEQPQLYENSLVSVSPVQLLNLNESWLRYITWL